MINSFKFSAIVMAFIFVFAVIGEIRCIVKAVNCNWDPIGKAEIVYTGAAVTGLGAIVGWFNIEDE